TNPEEASAPLPAADTEAAVVRVTVTDSAGLTARATSAPFAIDSTPPSLLTFSPSIATAVDSMADFRLVFSEPIDPAGVASAVGHDTPNFWVEGATEELAAHAETTALPSDTVVVRHATIRNNVTFTLVLAGLRDASFPGNPLSQRISFTAWDVRPPTALLAVNPSAVPGDVVVLDGSASTDNDAILDYAWTIRDGAGDAVAHPSGERAAWRATEGEFTVTLEVTDAGGNVAEASAPLYVHAIPVAGGLPSTEVTILGWLALAGAGGSGSYAFTDRGRSLLSRVFLLPLYVKLKPEAVKNQETRGMIRGYIRVHPGDCYTDIMRNLGLANGEIAYHLMVLEREGIVRSTTRGSRRLYYPAEMPMPEDGGGMHEVQQRLLRNVSEVPGMAIRDLAGILGVSSQLALYHVRKLSQDGLVRFERHGVKLRVFPTTPEERLAFRRQFGET
ncbi:MAG: winged helix-turn-helix transcriptional regulator, partial [Candidatus Thermoplasmatota archaeon]